MFVNKKYAFFWFNVQVFAMDYKKVFSIALCARRLTVSGSRRMFCSFPCSRDFSPSFGKSRSRKFLQGCRRIFYILTARRRSLRVLPFFRDIFRIRIQIKAYKTPL